VDSIRYTVLVHPDQEAGGYYATAPAIPGVVGQGESVVEALEDVRAALTFTLEGMAEDGEDFPPDEPVEDHRGVELGFTRTA